MKKLSVTTSKNEMICGLAYIGIQILLLPVLLAQGNLLLGKPLSAVQLNFLLFCIDFICVAVIFRNFLWRSAKQSLSSPFRCLRSAVIGLLLYWLGTYAVNFLIFAVSPDFSNVNDASIYELVQENYTLMTIGTVILVPIVEETLYRGVIFGNLYRKNRLAAYVISTFIFASLHVIGYISQFEPMQLALCFLQYIPAGLCLARAYVSADSIWAPILMHMTINQIGALAMR